MAWNPGLLKPHGTMAAVRRHRRYGESLCRPCQQAERRDSADRYDPARRHAAYLAERQRELSGATP